MIISNRTTRGLFKIVKKNKMEDKNKKQNKISKYFKESAEEYKKIKWPTKNETLNQTILVIFICAFVAIFLGLLDFGLTHLIEWLISLK